MIKFNSQLILFLRNPGFPFPSTSPATSLGSKAGGQTDTLMQEPQLTTSFPTEEEEIENLWVF